MAPRHRQDDDGSDAEMAYDPDQNREEQRDVRQKYRHMAGSKSEYACFI